MPRSHPAQVPKKSQNAAKASGPESERILRRLCSTRMVRTVPSAGIGVQQDALKKMEMDMVQWIWLLKIGAPN